MKRKKNPVEDSENSTREKSLKPSSQVQHTLSCFTRPDGSEYRFSTIVQSLDSVLLTSSYSSQLKACIHNCSTAMGIASHLTSVYLNARANSNAAFPLAFDRNYIRQVMQKLSGHDVRNMPHDPFFENYLQQHPLPESTATLLQTYFLKRCKDYLCDEMMEAAERHVQGNFENRILQNIEWQLNCRLSHLSDTGKHDLQSVSKDVVTHKSMSLLFFCG